MATGALSQPIDAATVIRANNEGAAYAVRELP